MKTTVTKDPKMYVLNRLQEAVTQGQYVIIAHRNKALDARKKMSKQSAEYKALVKMLKGIKVKVEVDVVTCIERREVHPNYYKIISPTLPEVNKAFSEAARKFHKDGEYMDTLICEQHNEAIKALDLKAQSMRDEIIMSDSPDFAKMKNMLEDIRIAAEAFVQKGMRIM